MPDRGRQDFGGQAGRAAFCRGHQDHRTDAKGCRHRIQCDHGTALFRKAKVKALVEDLHFHDFRHLAITRLAHKLDVLALARMVGHRDLRQLQVYYNMSAEDMAGRLD